MADNIGLANGKSVATDEETVNGTGQQVQLNRVIWGDKGNVQRVKTTTPLPVRQYGGTFGYAAGSGSATVDIPAGARVHKVSVKAPAGADCSLAIAGGNTITVKQGDAFDEQIYGEVPVGSDVTVTGSAAYFVSWTVD